MAHLRDVVFDCAHPAGLARFWTSVLDGYEIAPYDDGAMADLRAQGIDDPEHDPTVVVIPVAGPGPRVWFTLVPEAKTVKNRVHLDVETDDLARERTRLERLGARVITVYDDYLVLCDPEENEFCLMQT